MEPTINQDVETPTPEEARKGRVEEMRSKMRVFIRSARGENSTELRCRELSEAITCAETAYLWLSQMSDEAMLKF